MLRIVLLLALSLSLPCLEARDSHAALVPAAVSIGLGYSNQLGPMGNSYTPVPSVSALWHLTSHVSVFSKVSYLQRRYLEDRFLTTYSGGIYPFSPAQPATVRNHFIPLGAGIRLSAENATRSRGVFVEAGPAAFLTSMDTGGVWEERVLAGFQAGAGIRFPGFGRSHVDLGMSFYRSEQADLPEDAPYGPTAYRKVEAYVLYLGIGLGR